MTYYKIKKEYDNKKRCDGSILVKNELYTKTEINKYKIPLSYCDIVQISKNKIYWCFGARFA